jgi:hypothetical protein
MLYLEVYSNIKTLDRDKWLCRRKNTKCQVN